MVNQAGSYDLLIQKLDRFIRKFYLNQLIRGLLYSTGFIIGLFLLFSLLENYFYFDKAVRKLIFFGFIAFALMSTSLFVLIPVLKYFKLGKQINHETAAVIIGDHFIDVKDQLLNVLQLKKQASGKTSIELISASIDQKSARISPVPFRSAIDLSKNRKYLKYALPPALILIVIFFASPTMITEPTHRIINNNIEFEKAAPFSFDIINENLDAVQYEDYTIEMITEGTVVPNEVFIDVDNFQYRMKKSGNKLFSYTFKNVQDSQDFSFFSGTVRSKSYALKVLLKPSISSFDLHLDYPSYTGRRDEVVSNIGDVVIPEGTKVNWHFITENTDAVSFKFSGDKNKTAEAERRSDNSFQYEKMIFKDQIYKIYYANSMVPAPDSVAYAINVQSDEYPEISVESFRDSLEKNLVYFIGSASDDYGLLSVNFNYTVNRNDGSIQDKKMPLINPKSRETDYTYRFDISELALKPGEKLSYYFEAFDNDAVNGSKSARTSVLLFEKPSLEEFEQQEDQNEEDITDKLENSLKESKRIREELRELRDKMLQKREPDWEDKKELENLMERQNKMEDELKEAKEKFDENLENQEEFTQREEELKEKQERLQELFEESMDSETQELMEKIQELMEELDKDQMIQEMENLDISEEAMEKNTERLLELFKTLEVEKEVKDLSEKLQEMSEKQDSLSQESSQADQKEEQEAIKEEQDKLNEEFEKMQEKMDEILEKNSELERPKDLSDDNKEKMDDIKKDMQNSSESLEEQQNKQASQKQKKASEKMKEMAERMSSSMSSGQMQQMQEDMAALRQLLENLVTLSFDQEDLINNLQRTQINTPSYVSHIQQQFKLKDDFVMIKDSLQELAKRVDQIQGFVLEKVAEVEKDMGESLNELEERQKPEAEASQRGIMKNVNDLALMLSESMEQMQQQMSGMMMGTQMCNNPGGMGPGGKQSDIPMDKITEGQKEMSEDMKQMMEQGKKEGGNSARSFAEAAARQAALRKALEELQREKMEQGKGDKGLQELIDAMDKVETDLVNKRLDNAMLLRQQEILTRLLEAEEAERQREFDNTRKSETGKEYRREFPPALQEYLKKRASEIEMYEKVSPSLRPYYKRLVDAYYKSLKNNS